MYPELPSVCTTRFGNGVPLATTLTVSPFKWFEAKNKLLPTMLVELSSLTEESIK